LAVLKLDQKLRKLRLGYAASVLEAHHQAAINAKLSYLEFLEKLLDDELNARDNKGLDKRVRAARFPVTKTLEEFDFAFQPSINVKQIKGSFKIRVDNRTKTHALFAKGFPCERLWKA
jgi:DNA replication protein DnaC